MSADRPRPLVAGNWKMHGLKSSVQVLHDVAEGYAPALKDKVDLLICPPATLIHAFALQGVGDVVEVDTCFRETVDHLVRLFKTCFDGRSAATIAGALHGYVDDVATYVTDREGRTPALLLLSPILLDDSVFRRGRMDSQNAMVVAESVAKIWIGNSIVVTGDGAGVIREGLVRYIATQFLESKFGKDIADLERQRQRVAYAAVSRRDSPLTVVSPFDDYYFPEVANKGAMAWRILAKKIGSDEFYKALRSAAQDGTVTLAELRSQFTADHARPCLRDRVLHDRDRSRRACEVAPGCDLRLGPPA